MRHRKVTRKFINYQQMYFAKRVFSSYLFQRRYCFINMWQNFLIPSSVKLYTAKNLNWLQFRITKAFLSFRCQYILFISIKRKIFFHLNVSNNIWFGFLSHDNHKFEMNKILVFDIRSFFCPTQILVWKDIYFVTNIQLRIFLWSQNEENCRNVGFPIKTRILPSKSEEILDRFQSFKDNLLCISFMINLCLRILYLFS